MRIAVLGAGNVGGALAKGWAKAGHEIILGVRDRSNPDLQALINSHPGISATGVGMAAKSAEVIVVALPAKAVINVFNSLGDLSDKIVIDATNSLFSKPGSYNHASDAIRKINNCLRIVKCFNTTGFENMENPVYNGEAIDMFMAGDDPEAKDTAAKLSGDLGFGKCHDFGGFDRIPLLEQLAMAWINLAIMQKKGRNIAFKILER